MAKARKDEAKELEQSTVAQELERFRVIGEAGRKVFTGNSSTFVFGQNAGLFLQTMFDHWIILLNVIINHKLFQNDNNQMSNLIFSWFIMLDGFNKSFLSETIMGKGNVQKSKMARERNAAKQADAKKNENHDAVLK